MNIKTLIFGMQVVAFLFAGATAAFRIANNKHFASDVLVGAGIGTSFRNYIFAFESVTIF